MRWTALVLMPILASCMPPQEKPKSSSELAMETAQREAIAHPIGRFVVAGTRQYSNGTDIYVLDSKTGQVCYYFSSSGKKIGEEKIVSDYQSCAGPALAP